MKISLITVVYNAVQTLPDTFKSVFEQSIVQELEYIVIDGGSTDGSRALIEKHKAQIIQVLLEPDKGLYDALNKGLKLATGDVIGFIHADDVLANAFVLEKIRQTFQEQQVDGVYGDLNYVSEDLTRVVRKWKSGSQGSFSLGWMPPHPAFYFKKSILKTVGNFSLEMGTAGDYEWMLRAIHKHKISLAYLPEVLVLMRMGGMSNSDFDARKKAFANDLKAWTINGYSKNLLAILLKKIRKLPQYI